jgi:hypothetical protein
MINSFSKIKYLDILAYTPQLRINKQDSNKTILGGIVSILLVGTLLAVFIYFGKDIINKTNPLAISSD